MHDVSAGSVSSSVVQRLGGGPHPPSSSRRASEHAHAINSGRWDESLAGTQKKQARELLKRPATGEWKHVTMRLLDEARQTKQNSMVLRDANNVVKKTGERDVKDTFHVVNEELRKKVALTAKLKAKLEKQVQQTTSELSALVEARARTKAKLDERKKPLKVARQRLQTRALRPASEQIHDTADRTLRSEALELQGAVKTLVDAVQQSADVITRLEASLKALKADLRDKAESLRLDKECLDVHLPSEKAAAGGGGGGGGGGSGGVGQLHGSRGAAAAGGTTKTLEWQATTSRLLVDASDTEQSSMRLRKVLAQTVASLGHSHHQAYGAVNDALRCKVKQTKLLQLQLQQNLAAVMKELEELELHRASIQGTLDQKKEPLAVVQKRLSLRKLRPERESIRDTVEEALEAELHKLQAIMASLSSKLTKIDSEKQRLGVLRRQLENDLSNKGSALKQDKKALALDLTQMRYVSPPPPPAPPFSSRPQKKGNFSPTLFIRIHPLFSPSDTAAPGQSDLWRIPHDPCQLCQGILLPAPILSSSLPLSPPPPPRRHVCLYPSSHLSIRGSSSIASGSVTER